MVNGVLYKLSSDGTIVKMTFNGSAYGTSSPVEAGDSWSPERAGTATSRTMTSVFYDNGGLFYTKSGSNALYRRGFEIEDDVVGQQVFTTTTSDINWSTVRGAFVVGTGCTTPPPPARCSPRPGTGRPTHRWRGPRPS